MKDKRFWLILCIFMFWVCFVPLLGMWWEKIYEPPFDAIKHSVEIWLVGFFVFGVFLFLSQIKSVKIVEGGNYEKD
jgi:uncharacterized membrane protein